MNKILRTLGYLKILIYKAMGNKITYGVKDFFHPCAKVIIKGKNAKITFKDNCIISKGCKIIVNENSELYIGSNVVIQENCCIEVGKNAELRIDDETFLNEYCRIICLEKIYIGKNVAIGPEVSFYDNDHIMKKNSKQDWSKFKSSPITIGDNVWIGAKSIILRKSVIAHNSIIAAMSVVKSDIKENSIYYINNEKKIKEIE